MLIYHVTDDKLQCVQVTLGAGKPSVQHGIFVRRKHLEKVNELRNNGKVFVTGGTHCGAVYDGSFEDRKKYQHYIDMDV